MPKKSSTPILSPATTTTTNTTNPKEETVLAPANISAIRKQFESIQGSQTTANLAQKSQMRSQFNTVSVAKKEPTPSVVVMVDEPEVVVVTETVQEEVSERKEKPKRPPPPPPPR